MIDMPRGAKDSCASRIKHIRHYQKMIEKNVFQTWHTRDLPVKIQKRIDIWRKLNPDYKYHLFLDAEIDAFVHDHFPGAISEAYDRLNIIVAKTDFWRYLVLYKYGGVYLDIDSCINRPLNTLIRETDEAIITAEKNPSMFVQWCLIFKSGHPILKRAIDLTVENIMENRYPDDIIRMTGPGVFSDAIQQCYHSKYDAYIGHHLIVIDTEDEFETVEGVKCRVFGIDYNKFMTFKVKDAPDLYVSKTHWSVDSKNKPLLRNP